jgi:hypothetical protein
MENVRTLIFSLAFSLLAACGGADPYDPEAELREWVARGETAAEEKDRGGLLDMISADYVDARGNDHESIGDMLRVYFFRQQSIALLTSIDDIALMGDTAALVNVTVGMAGTGSGALGLNADAYRFEFELEKMDDEWMLIGARWAEIGRDLR